MEPTPTHERLTVRVAADLVLDMGTVERTTTSSVRIHPPEPPLFDQVVSWLDSRAPCAAMAPEDPRAGVATALVCIRWGTWFALLTDPGRPTWPHAKERDTSHVTDEEMVRLNIEASSALERWIDILRADPDRWSALAGKALVNLPWSGGPARPRHASYLWAINDPKLRRLYADLGGDGRAFLRARLGENPTRVCANAVTANAWRNGPIEDIHDGRYRGAPLTHRRVTHAAEKRVLDYAAGELAVAVARLATTRGQDADAWADTLLPLAVVGPMGAPHDWSTTERSRAIVLDAEGYAPADSPAPILPDTPAREIRRDKPSI